MTNHCYCLSICLSLSVCLSLSLSLSLSDSCLGLFTGKNCIIKLSKCVQHCLWTNSGSWDSVASVLTMGSTIRFSITCKSKRYLFLKTPTTAVGPSSHLFDRYRGNFFSLRLNGRRGKLITSLHIVPKWRIRLKILPLPLYVQKHFMYK